ncbi:MAG: hypothetical protein AAFO29_25565 [Actinomycetota bacterium]
MTAPNPGATGSSLAPNPILGPAAILRIGRDLAIWAVVLSIGVLLGWDAFDLFFVAWFDATAFLVLGIWGAFLGSARRLAGGCLSVVVLFFAGIPWLIGTFLIPVAVARPDALVGVDQTSVESDDFAALFDRVDAMAVVSVVALLAWIAAGEIRHRRSGAPTDALASLGAAVGRSLGLTVAVMMLLEDPGEGPMTLVGAIVGGRAVGLVSRLVFSNLDQIGPRVSPGPQR